MKRQLGSVALAVALAAGSASWLGCGESTGMPTEATLVKTDPVPQNGMQIILPVVKDLMPGESYEMCTWTDKILETDLDVKSSTGYQSSGGHHVVLFYTTKQQPPGTTRVCTDDDMATFRFAVGTGEGLTNVAPGDLAFHLPKGAQLVANHHYINASPTALSAQSAMNIEFVAPGQKSTRSGSIAFVDSDLVVPPGISSRDISCTLTRDTKLWMLLPHMHRWGKHIDIEHVSSGQKKRLISLDWREEYEFHAPEMRSDLASPFVLKKGDQINTHCEWNNNTGKPLPFGLEMCVTFGQTINADNLENIACDKGDWTPF
jgi:hypothetical protein